jgi:hypothetical protein
LMLASPAVAVDGPREVYARIQEVIRKSASESSVPLHDISVVDSKDPLVRLLKTAVQTGPAISGIRFSRNTINGHFIEDAYIYRMT